MKKKINKFNYAKIMIIIFPLQKTLFIEKKKVKSHRMEEDICNAIHKADKGLLSRLFMVKRENSTNVRQPNRKISKRHKRSFYKRGT